MYEGKIACFHSVKPHKYMQLHFYGAAQEVTGSCYLVDTKSRRILIDCGMFQGERYADEKNEEHFPFDPTTIDTVLITHAHIDHNGRIPKLVREGFRGKIWATKPTRELIYFMWQDTVHIMRYAYEKTGQAMLYDEADVKHAYALIQGVPYGERVELGSEVWAEFHDAGHILGSSWIRLHSGERELVFSGDIGNDEAPIIRDTELIGNADYIICESTYGDRIHEEIFGRKSKLKTVIEDTIARGGTLLIPAFSIERTQEILYELNWLIEECKCLPKVPIYLDSPLAIHATGVFKEYKEYYDTEAKELSGKDRDLFSFPGLVATISSEESKKINTVVGSKVIIAGSGMMNGGRIMHHLPRYLPDPKSTLLVVSYQAEGTLGRKITSGAKSVQIFGEKVDIKCRIEAIHSYSAHGDQEKLLSWIRSGKNTQHIYITHGDKLASENLAVRIEKELKISASVPAFGSRVEM